jgi:hypothetical protein
MFSVNNIDSIVQKTIPKFHIANPSEVIFGKIHISDTFERIAEQESMAVQKEMETNPEKARNAFESAYYAISSHLGNLTNTALAKIETYQGETKKQMVDNLNKLQGLSEKAMHSLFNLFVQKSKNPEVLKIEKELAQKFNVKTNFSDNLEIANLTKTFVEKAIQKGRKPPTEIAVCNFIPEGGQAVFYEENGKTIEAIFLSPNIKPTSGYLSTDEAGHVIVHEFGHIEDFRRNGKSKWINQDAEVDPSSLTKAEQKLVGQEVGDYAQNIPSGLETFPEIYAGLFYDKKYSPEVMKLYTEKLNGVTFSAQK